VLAGGGEAAAPQEEAAAEQADAAEAKAAPAKRRGRPRPKEPEEKPEAAAVLGWETQAPATNPLEARAYAVPMMTAEELGSITVALEEVEARLPATLQEHGCAVVTGVASAEELRRLEGLFQEDLQALLDPQALEKAPEEVREAFRRFAEEGPRAFPAATAAKFTASAGFVLRNCLMQGRFAWRARGLPEVHRCFAALFPGEPGPLVTSMDVTFFTPEGDTPKRINKFSAHVDQNLHDVREGLSDCPVFQGALYVWAADELSSTTSLWPGSHKEPYASIMEDGMFKQSGKRGMHYCEISCMRDRERATALAEGWATNARRVPVPAGGLLLWSSRLAHAGWKGGPRLAQAVCLEPRARRSESQRLAKLRLAALGLPSTHWAQVAMQHDMVLADPGFFSRRRTPAKTGAGTEGEGEDHDRVVLPMRPATRPSPLAAKADLKTLKLLANVKHELTGMWVPSESSAQLLESSVTEECKALV